MDHSNDNDDDEETAGVWAKEGGRNGQDRSVELTKLQDSERMGRRGTHNFFWLWVIVIAASR